jgi:hypothetical protein
MLGGEWWITEDRKKSGQTVKETIYSVFTMLEAVRMIKTDVFVPDEERDACSCETLNSDLKLNQHH